MRMIASELEDATGEAWGVGLTEYGAVLSDMDDLWNFLDKGPDKFELLDLPLGERALDDELGDILDWTLDTMETSKIVNHDCMWAGTCSDKYHPGNGHSLCSFTPQPCNLPLSPVHVPAPSPAVTLQSTLPGRSLLLSASRAPPTKTRISRKAVPPAAISPPPPSPRRPDTPQSLDEEEPPQFKHHLDLAACAPAQTSASLILQDYQFDDDDPDGEDDNDDNDDDEDDYDDDESDYKHHVYQGHSSYDRHNSRDSRIHYRESTIASDHSYTLCKTSKQAMDGLGVQTPSDSEEEEIDVETLGDKLSLGGRVPVALPTNPSAQDRHQLQRSVASAMGRPRSRGARPPRPPRPHKRSRDSSPPPPRHRKRQKLPKQHSPQKRRTPSSPNSDSEAENIEKRSLHNDMERQRRIGLKNLFDELKREVPSIREKERAPKVVVLREAALLCSRLQREDREREQLRARQARLLARVRHLRMDLAARRPVA